MPNVTLAFCSNPRPHRVLWEPKVWDHSSTPPNTLLCTQSWEERVFAMCSFTDTAEPKRVYYNTAEHSTKQKSCCQARLSGTSQFFQNVCMVQWFAPLYTPTVGHSRLCMSVQIPVIKWHLLSYMTVLLLSTAVCKRYSCETWPIS